MKNILILLSVLILGFFVWMNVTSGHFQKVCCDVIYTSKVSEIMCKCKAFTDDKNILLLLSTFDLNK